MFYKTILWFVILVNFTPLNAQQNFSDFKVNFNVGEYVLDKGDIETLNALIDEAKAAGYYEVTLSAHTDNDGSNNFNYSLSGKRANSVRDYLILNGMNANVMDIAWLGEKTPEASNDNDMGKSINRRVVVTLKKYNLNNIEDLLKTTGGAYTQNFTLNSSQDNTIVGKNGTKVFLPGNALVTMDGKPVSSENVTIELQEFHKSQDAIFNLLSTTCEGKILESGGMFNIAAKYNGESLKLAEGETMEVEMPSSNIKSDMQIFTGIKNEQGITEWKATSTPFSLKLKEAEAVAFVKLDVNYLNSIKQTNNIDCIDKVERRYKLPVAIQKPLSPRYPRLLDYPDEHRFFSRFDKLTKSKSRRERLLSKEHERIDRINKKKMDRYHLYLEKYNALLDRYPLDSLDYVSGQDAFYSWVGLQRENCRKRIMEYEKEGFNRAVNRLISLSDRNRISAPLSIGIFSRTITYKEVEQYKLMELFRLEYQLTNLLQLPYKEVVNGFSVNGFVDLDKGSLSRKHSVWNQDFSYRLNSSDFAKEFYRANPELQEMFAEANLELLKKNQKNGKTDFNSLNSIYAGSISGFGPVNCDRFSNTPASQMVKVSIECEGEPQVSFFIPSINSYLYAYKNSETGLYEVSLPAGVEATMVVVGLSNGSPVFLKKRMNVNQKMSLVANPAPATLKEIHAEVASI